MEQPELVSTSVLDLEICATRFFGLNPPDPSLKLPLPFCLEIS
jgi:hypothetical protein